MYRYGFEAVPAEGPKMKEKTLLKEKVLLPVVPKSGGAHVPTASCYAGPEKRRFAGISFD